MARQRDYRADYLRRLARGAGRGLSRQEARGHGRTPEHPERVLRFLPRYESYALRHVAQVQRLGKTPRVARDLAALNQERADQQLGPIILGEAPPPGPGTRQRSAPTLADADDRIRFANSVNYTRVYLTRTGWVYEIDRGTTRRSRRRRAA